MINGDDGNEWRPGLPPGGKGTLRAMLDALQEDKKKMYENPLYKEGFDDGYNEALTNYQRLTKALHALYNVDRDLM